MSKSITKVWCLFSVENNYDQPPHNLTAWWSERPSFETLLNAIGGSFQQEEAVICAANLIQGVEDVRFDNTDWTLKEVREGVIDVE